MHTNSKPHRGAGKGPRGMFMTLGVNIVTIQRYLILPQISQILQIRLWLQTPIFILQILPHIIIKQKWFENFTKTKRLGSDAPERG